MSTRTSSLRSGAIAVMALCAALPVAALRPLVLRDFSVLSPSGTEMEPGHTVLVRGETLRGTARAVLDEPAYTKEVFKRLRPDALEGFGTLVEVRLDDTESEARDR